MNRKITLATLTAALLLLAGCATMNEEECRSADWYSVGFEDGAHGRAINYIGNHREACAEYGISPQADRYLDGWNEGIRRYCTPRNGYQAGMRGASRSAQCPADLARDFDIAYQYGHRIHLLNRELSAVDQDMRTAQSELDQVKLALAQIEKQLMGGGYGDREQDRLNARLRQLYRQEADIEAQLAALDRAKRRTPDEPPEKKKDKDKDKERDKDNGRDKEDNGTDNGREKDKQRDNGNNRDNDNRRFAFAPRGQENDKQRQQLEKKLAEVRREIRSLEAQLDRRERQQNNWELVQRSRQLSLREGQLLAQLEIMHRERMDLEREIDWQKRHSPY